jgi:hypothetical protein
MDERQRYLFDLQGYLVLKNVVPKETIEACNRVLDVIEQCPPEKYPSVGFMPDWGKFGLTFSDSFLAELTDPRREIVRLKDR